MSNRMVDGNVMAKAAIAELRRAAHAQDSNACDAALDQALAGLPSATMMALAEAMLRDGLPAFERNHPGESWPRRALDGEADGIPPECTGPGGNSLACGVEFLLDARAGTGDPTVCRSAVVEAITSSIMGAKNTAWGAIFPERWRQWYNDLYKEERPKYLCGEDPKAGWYKHPEVMRINLERWTYVADRLETAWADIAGASHE